jgi:hypothetical protein
MHIAVRCSPGSIIAGPRLWKDLTNSRIGPVDFYRSSRDSLPQRSNLKKAAAHSESHRVRPVVGP